MEGIKKGDHKATFNFYRKNNSIYLTAILFVNT